MPKLEARRALGPFEAVRELGYIAPFPSLLPVRQVFRSLTEDDPAGAAKRELAPLTASVRPGMRVAITAGSRGIRDLALVVRAAGEFLRALGAEPFVVPAMGSHGGATVAGQLQVLAHLGVTEDSVSMPILATMDTVIVGRCEDGPTIHVDSHAAKADAILLVNRVKPHTDFRGPVESGLAKICAVGLGNQRGAQGIHAYGASALARLIPEIAKQVIASVNVLGGLAIIENALDLTARITFVPGPDIGGAAEAALLEEAYSLMGGLPFEELDVLVVDELGKDKSGSGMDTNVIGRSKIWGVTDSRRPRIATITVHAVSPAAEGNGLGIGLADFIPFRVLEQVDLSAMYVNAMTAGNSGTQRVQIPIALPTDRDVVAAAILTCGRPDSDDVRLVRIHDTLDLSHLLVSESLRATVEAAPGLIIEGEPGPMSFDEFGNLAAHVY